MFRSKPSKSCSSGGLENPKHTRLVKVKFYFKNKKTGKVIIKTSTKVKYNEIVVKPIKGYSLYKATVWYKIKNESQIEMLNDVY